MFTPEDRERIRKELVEVARADQRLTGGAITGSASIGGEDAWSDIDLAFGVRDVSNVASALGDFSARMYDKYEALHHLDVPSGSWIYRVFFLANTLQVDLAFAPEDDFGARGPTFKLLFGIAKGGAHPKPPDAEQLIGMAWLYALHVRSSIARKKVMQAECMLGEMRNNTLALACVRQGMPHREGRGLDQLPSDFIAAASSTLPRSLEIPELKRAFQSATSLLISEVRFIDPRLAVRLERALLELSS